MGKVFTAGLNKTDRKEGLLKRLANINHATNLKNISPGYDLGDIDYYLKNKDKVDTQKIYNMYGKLESIEEKYFMINEFYKKIENIKNDDSILSDDINKKN